jgi:4-amino-4-deoxy-L-arabinose transferase-like glycosyltransferase
MQPKKLIDNTKFYYISLAFIIIARLILNAVVPLMDKTEARYAEIARIMAETGNWVTPQIDYGIPFWAKPPLSTLWA